VKGVPNSNVGRSTCGISTWFGFLYILNPFLLKDVVKADMVEALVIRLDMVMRKQLQYEKP
jgi:hypothetical protein